MFEPKHITFTYVAHDGTVTVRRAHPLRTYFGPGEFIAAPPEAGWWLRCHDLDRDDTRDFRIAGMSDITEESPTPAAKGATP